MYQSTHRRGQVQPGDKVWWTRKYGPKMAYSLEEPATFIDVSPQHRKTAIIQCNNQKHSVKMSLLRLRSRLSPGKSAKGSSVFLTLAGMSHPIRRIGT